MLCPISVKTRNPKRRAVATVCAPCHLLDGIGHDIEVPNIAGQHSVYLREQLLAFKSGRRKHPEMYFVGRRLTDREIDELVVYYSTLLSP
jgi:cytochrome c553